ncbi:Lrp/AsnC family transcriptional regulator [Micromonospora matsumotoense]|uniref:Lrp/AsnC family transcriptional regulator n=1 Tax=Micromonospora matsumotoense TaxID=121616 RepID=UPI0034275D6B
MDRLDEQILGILTDNARCSFSEIGRQVGLSTNAAAARVRRLEDDGIILGYTVVTGQDAPELRGGLEVFIDVRLDAGTDYETFVAAIAPIEQIIDAVHMTGPYDYLLRARLRDTAALDSLLRRLKKSCGVVQTQTRVALRQPAPRWKKR